MGSKLKPDEKVARRESAVADFRSGGFTREALAAKYEVHRNTVAQWLRWALQRDVDRAQGIPDKPPMAPRVAVDGTPLTDAQRHLIATGNEFPSERVLRVMDMLTGTREHAPSTVSHIEYVCCKEWGVNARQVRNYIRIARKRLAIRFQSANANTDSIRAQTDAMLIDAFTTAKSKGDAHTMVISAQRRAELFGGFVQKFEHKHKVTGLADLLNELEEPTPGSEAHGDNPNGDKPASE